MRQGPVYCDVCDEYVEVFQSEEELYLGHAVKACGHAADGDNPEFIPDRFEELNFEE